MLPEDAALETLVSAVADQLGDPGVLRRQFTPVETRFSPYHQAAAVLSTFDIKTLHAAMEDKYQSAPARARALDALRADSIPATDAYGREGWTLRTDVRREVLRSLGNRSSIERALAASRELPHDQDPVQAMFEAYVRGTAPPLSEQSARELTGTSKVVEWLEGLGLAPTLPDRIAVEHSAQRATLLQPFYDLAGTDFAGRVAELAQIREYIGVLPPGSVREQLLRIAASFFNLREKPPLMIWGHGGLGKSTLVSRVILEHATLPNTERFPWAYLDFDRTVLLAEEPLTLLIEAVRQLGVQYPEAAEFCERLRRGWLAELGDRPDEIKRAMGRHIQVAESARLAHALDPIDQERHLRDFGALLRNLKVETDPFLLVLDTFERLQYRSEAVVLGVCAFLERFQAHVPRLRTVIAGRAQLTDASFPTQELHLGDFDKEAAVALLLKKGVPNASVARRLFAQVGGNPLSLRLAAELLKREDFTRGSFTTRRLFGFRLEENEIQAQLFGRILNHIRDLDVRKLAYPGLVLRRVTAEIIQSVLAKPCGVEVPDAATAQRLFDEMSREVGLVTVLGPVIVYRADVRRFVLRTLREREPTKVSQIEEAAVDYYFSRSGVSNADERLIERAEEIYHRLSMQQPLDRVAIRWLPGVEPYLAGAVDELSPRERAWLASRIGRTLTDEEREQADLEGWERDTLRRVRDLIQQGLREDALFALRERSDRRPGSPLYALEAELCELLEQWDAMQAIAERGIQSADEAGQRYEAISLRIWGARADMRRHLLQAANQKLDEADELLLEGMTTRAIEVMLNRLALIRAQHADHTEEPGGFLFAEPIKQRLLERTKELDNSEFLKEPSLLAWVAVEVGIDDWRLLERVVRVIGLPVRSKARIRLLAQAVAAVDAAQPIMGCLADRAGAPPAASLTERWSRLMVSVTPQALGTMVANLLPDVQANLAVTFSVIALLRETARARFVPGDVWALEEDRQRAAEAISFPGETRAPRPRRVTTVASNGKSAARPSSRLGLTGPLTAHLHDALLSAFPTREALEVMVRFQLDRDLDAIAPLTDLRRTVLHLIKTAEAEGWAANLVASAREVNPGNPALQEFGARFGLAADLPKLSDLENTVRVDQGFMDLIRWREQLGTIEGQVCRLEIEGRPVGTGFLVGPDLLMTAFHVLDTIIDGKRAPTLVRCRFDYKQLKDGNTVHEGTAYELAHQEWLVHANRSASYEDLMDIHGPALGPNQLNYALVRLARSAGADPIGGDRASPSAPSRRWIAIKAGVGPRRGGSVLIVQHPEGRPLQIAFDSNGVLATDNDGTRILYRANTAPGSSGSPCFNSHWQLIGIHVASSPRAEINVGISINAIANRLFEAGLGNLLDQVLP